MMTLEHAPVDATQAKARALIEAIIDAYHTTRLDPDYVPHILAQPPVQRAFSAFAKEATPSVSVERRHALPVEAEHLSGCDHTRAPAWICDCPRPIFAALTLPVPSAPQGGEPTYPGAATPAQRPYE